MSEDDVQAAETGPVHDEARHAMKMAKKKTAREKIMATKTDQKGLIIVNTGKGKGKSTAGFGMIFRHIAHGMPSAVVQFIKGAWETGERDLIEKHFGDVCQFYTLGEGFTWETQDRSRDIAMAEKAWEKAKELIRDERNSMVLLDEINIALRYDYIDVARGGAVPERRKAADDACGADRPQCQGRADRGRRSRHRNGTDQASLPLRYQGAGRRRVLTV